jgi:hypothetical protein
MNTEFLTKPISRAASWLVISAISFGLWLAIGFLLVVETPGWSLPAVKHTVPKWVYNATETNGARPVHETDQTPDPNSRMR